MSHASPQTISFSVYYIKQCSFHICNMWTISLSEEHHLSPKLPPRACDWQPQSSGIGAVRMEVKNTLRVLPTLKSQSDVGLLNHMQWNIGLIQLLCSGEWWLAVVFIPRQEIDTNTVVGSYCDFMLCAGCCVFVAHFVCVSARHTEEKDSVPL